MYKNTNCFHLAVPCGDLEIAKKFYSETLGCRLDNSAKEWADVDFWGNELTLHASKHKLHNERHDVDMGNVSVPHFGVHLSGITDVSPLMIPVFPFGIIYGVIGMEFGLSAYMTFGMSIIIFGGASQIVLLQLFSGGASSFITITSVGAVNSRHLLYGAVFSEYLSHLKITWKIILSYVLVDQAFAVSNIYFRKNKKNKYKHFHLLGAGFTCWTIWQISTILGIVLGSVVPEELGLSFTISLTFLALLISDFRKFKNIIVMLVSGLVAIIGYTIIPFHAYIIVAALSALIVATLLTWTDSKKK